MDTQERRERARNSAKGSRILLILPCFNEVGSIGRLLAEIHSVDPSLDTLVVDDCSVDETALVAAPLSPVVRLGQNLGIGGAVQTGIKYAYREGYDFCIQIDGDGQHPPDQIGKLVAAYDREPQNIVIGSRYIGTAGFQSTWSRRLGSRIISGMLALTFRKRVTDPTSGMRMMDRTAIRFFVDHYPHDFPEPISLARAFRNGLTVGEAPVRMRSREHGSSSLLGARVLFYMIRVISYIFIAGLENRRPLRREVA
jgi:glycosyltransferase involved in cell wall biosynthesis